MPLNKFSKANKCLRKLAFSVKSLTTNWSLFTSIAFLLNCNNIFHINSLRYTKKKRETAMGKRKTTERKIMGKFFMARLLVFCVFIYISEHKKPFEERKLSFIKILINYCSVQTSFVPRCPIEFIAKQIFSCE